MFKDPEYFLEKLTNLVHAIVMPALLEALTALLIRKIIYPAFQYFLT